MVSYDEDAEILGKYAEAFISAMQKAAPVFGEKTRELFEEALGEEIDSETWYKLDDLVEGYRMVYDDVGPQTMKRGGKASAEALPFSDSLGLEEAFEKLLEEHKNQYRNSDMEYPGGRYLFDFDGSTARLGADEAYPIPKPFVNGLYEGLIERFGSAHAMPQFDEVEPKNNEQFAWEVTW